MNIILASQSQRRIDLLNQFPIEFTVCPSTITEKFCKTDRPEITAMSLSFEKAYDIAYRNPDSIIIACDTVVFKNGVYGKPVDKADAFKMLSHLSDSEHFVYTGISLVHVKDAIKITTFEKTKVTFNTLTEDQIWRYIDSGEPFGKAGSYGIQGLGSVLVKEICGDYYNVMGLPLSTLNKLLKDHFNIKLL